MTGSLAGKTLFITGASRGIGLAIGLRAARDGANVAIAAKSVEPQAKLPGTIFTAAREIEAQLRDFWSDEKGFTRSRIGASGEKDLDIATLLAVIHAGRLEGAHSVRDPKTFATAARLEDLFGRLYKINEAAPEGRAPAMGRYADDRYYSGGAYYFSTLGAAEFYYRAAAARRDGSALHDADHVMSFDDLFRRGDMFMATVAAFTPANGDLSEQFDRSTGVQTSAKNLAWSHAAFITACASRAEALRSGGAAS